MSTASAIALQLATRVAEIKLVNGYLTDIGNKAFRGKRTIAEEELPCMVLIEGDDRVVDDSESKDAVGKRVTSVKLAQTYIFEGHAACDPNNPNDKAHEILTDLKRAIFAGDIDRGPHIKSIKYLGRSIGSREDGFAATFASVRIEVQFVETLNNP